MWFKKILDTFRSNLFCNKCGSPVKGPLLCQKCQEYVDYMERKREEEIRSKEELKRRNWIKTRDEFLNSKND